MTGHVPKCREPICPKCGTEKTLYGEKQRNWRCPKCTIEYQRKRYQDPVVRERERERKREYGRKWRQIVRERVRERYRTDPNYRERKCEQNRHRFRSKRACEHAINVQNAIRQIVSGVSINPTEG